MILIIDYGWNMESALSQKEKLKFLKTALQSRVTLDGLSLLFIMLIYAFNTLSIVTL